jgi:hypothetical protein
MTGAVHVHLARPDEAGKWPALLDALVRERPWPIFSERAQTFVAKWSRTVLLDPRSRQHPELLAMAHWFRAAHLRELASAYPSTIQRGAHERHHRVGRGLVFHIAPSNVDTVAMYSWLLSLLAGNANLVRISQTQTPLVGLMLQQLTELLSQPDFHPVRDRLVICTYAHGAEATSLISAACAARVVWGGDATVAALRQVPLRPTAVELCFADRFSLAALQAESVLAADDAALADLVQGFRNDSFWFAQQACSSPRVVVWVGSTPTIATARLRFWQALEAALPPGGDVDTAPAHLARVAALFEMAADGAAVAPGFVDRDSHYPTRADLSGLLDASIKRHHSGHGLFVEAELQSLVGLARHVSDKEQTVSWYGFSPAELDELVGALPARAVDRLVPVGEALAFNPVWDGQDFILSLSRIVSIRQSAKPGAR